jgi:anaerobic magnesium-protoporphyrin IX monomethyl ester cyclase
MDNILFIIPPCIRFEDFIHPKSNARIKLRSGKFYGNVLADMPIGVMSLSAYIKKQLKVKTKLVDFNIILNKLDDFKYSSFEELFKRTLTKETKFKPTVISISCLFSPAYQNLLTIAKVCRELFPKAYIFAGGAIPTNTYRQIFAKSDDFTALCYGEGEKPFLGFLKAKNKLHYLENHPSWITKRKVKAGKSFRFDFIENLDEIPFYDYDLCNVDDYALSPAIIAYSAVHEKARNFHVMTSRGCNFHCTFCSSHTVHGRRLRYFSVERVREDFTKLKNEYGAHILIFQDDHFLADKERALKIIEIIKELKLKAVFQNGLALYTLTRDILEAIKSAGVNQLVLAVESGSQRVLTELMHKPLTLEIVKRVANDCRDLGIYTDANLIIGMPGETKKDIRDARKFLKKLPINWYRITVATPLVGSDIYKLCLNRNYINKDSFANCHYKKAVIKTEDFTPEYIEEMQYFMNLELNFIHNSDYRLGNYQDALDGFLNAIKAKRDHAIAYYCASRCFEKLGNSDKAKKYRGRAREIIRRSPFWRNYANKFKLSI